LLGLPRGAPVRKVYSMLRILLLVLALVVLVAIGLVWTNIIDVSGNKVEVNPVTVGTQKTNVEIDTPTIQVQDQNGQPPAANAQ
jgi:hypothetical protein